MNPKLFQKLVNSCKNNLIPEVSRRWGNYGRLFVARMRVKTSKIKGFSRRWAPKHTKTVTKIFVFPPSFLIRHVCCSHEDVVRPAHWRVHGQEPLPGQQGCSFADVPLRRFLELCRGDVDPFFHFLRRAAVLFFLSVSAKRDLVDNFLAPPRCRLP